MKQFILALSALFIFTACSGSTGSETDFEGQRIGNWFTTSETSAQWVGSVNFAKRANAPGDTTFYAQPNGNDLVLHATDQGNENDIFSISYKDSSYSYAVFDTTDATSSIRFIDPFDKKANNGFIGVSDNYIDAGITVTSFNCDSTYNLGPAEDFAFQILNDDGGVYHTIVVDTDGVVEAMRNVGC